jgi:hypothetical protein
MTRKDNTPVVLRQDVSPQTDGMGTPATARALGQEVIEAMRARVTTEGTDHGNVVVVQHGRHHDGRS